MLRYHTTEQAAAILRGGFRDGTGSYGFVETELTGVFVSLRPVDVNEGAVGDQVPELGFPDDFDLAPWAIEEEAQEVWEWCMPASVISAHATVRLLTDEELQDI